MKKPLSILSCALLAALPATADLVTFDFEDPKGVNNVVFMLDAPLEQISGSANGISGHVKANPADPAEIEGRIVIRTETMHVPNPMMKEHLHGADWLDVEQHPEIVFELSDVSNLTHDGNKGTADVTGTMTIRDVTREITVPVEVTYLKDRLRDRGGDQDGDLLVLRSNFTVKRSDFGIKPGEHEDKVADDIEIRLSIAGAAPKS